MEKRKRVLPVMMAATIATVPFLSVPQAYAVTDVSVDADDTDTDEETDYTIEFEIEEDLDEGDEITITFDDEFEIDDDIDEGDVEVDGDEPNDVSYDDDDNSITIEVPDDYEEGDTITVDIFGVITNPEDDDDYKITVETENDDDDDYDYVEIGDGDDDDDDGEFDVDISTDEEYEEAKWVFDNFDLDDELEEDEEIVITFPDEDMLPSDIDTEDVEINGEEVDDVEVDDDEVTITIPSDVDGDDLDEIVFKKSAGIETPEEDDDYTITLEYMDEEYESEEFDIDGDGNSSSSSASSSSAADIDFPVSLSSITTGAASSFSFEANFGNSKLKAGDDVVIQFPAGTTMPTFLTTSNFTINGRTVSKASVTGNRLYLTAPSGMGTTNTVRVVISSSAGITHPKTPGSYSLSMTVDGKTITSDSFTIRDAVATPVTSTPSTTPATTTTPAPAASAVNNSTATVYLQTTALNAPAGFNIEIKGMGMPLRKGQDFIEVVLPAGFKVPAYIATTNVSVNRVNANYVAVRGNNLLIYPGQDIPAGTAASIIISNKGGIKTPSAKGVYNVSLYNSEEKGVLFSRPVSVGGAPLPKVTTPAPAASKPAATTPAFTIPAGAASMKLNVASFTLNGKTYPVSVAPYVSADTTMVPAQFFKEALALSTIWDQKTVSIVSGTTVARLTVGSNQAVIGNTSVTLPTAVQLKNGMPMVPVRAIAEKLGYKVGYDPKTGAFYVYK
ncbi:copper amine oxidase N-terminal domain-containing protein [Brevibacillus fulvus]|uniref:Copper amine oxidase-like N-terminal domain-containing protein n=1 Tax=Brevibacillus fulvus TaxID=1125967 RepID=A0A938XVS5_9BACL|nr:copper amine oxidase N-terminal domain-containing protein [Brevibacillus fulvus]MBM7588613.1 hypothetical protein [Brevibacillus fulvus]